MEYAGKKIWLESPDAADGYRKNYICGIEEYISRKNSECRAARRAALKPEMLALEQNIVREQFRQMLGLPLFSGRSYRPADLQYVGKDDICRIYRLVVYIVDQIPFYSILLLPHGVSEPIPLVIAQHGGGGTPELCCDMNGKNNYNHMVQRILSRGAAALAPQLLLWSQTELQTAPAHPIPYNRKKIDQELKRFGTSITAMEVTGIQKSLDYVSEMDCIDSERVAMIGLSYGGYFTLYTMAADTRIKAGYCAGAFNDRDVHCFEDWGYHCSALKFQDSEVAALCAPRKLYVQVGREDPVFDYRNAVPEAERALEFYNAFGCPENFRFDLWDGGHTVSSDDAGYDFLFSEL